MPQSPGNALSGGVAAGAEGDCARIWSGCPGGFSLARNGDGGGGDKNAPEAVEPAARQGGSAPCSPQPSLSEHRECGADASNASASTAGDVGPEKQGGLRPTLFFELPDATTTAARRIGQSYCAARGRQPRSIRSPSAFFCGVAAWRRAESPTSPAALLWRSCRTFSSFGVTTTGTNRTTGSLYRSAIGHRGAILDFCDRKILKNRNFDFGKFQNFHFRKFWNCKKVVASAQRSFCKRQSGRGQSAPLLLQKSSRVEKIDASIEG